MKYTKINSRNTAEVKRQVRESTGNICNIVLDGEGEGKPLTFDSITDAKDYLDTLPETKRSNTVRVFEKEGTKGQNERIESQRTQIAVREAKVDMFVTQWLDRVHTSTSKTKGCTECGTRFDRKDIIDIFCPECGKNMLASGDLKRYNRLLELVAKEENKLEVMINKRGGRTNKFYLTSSISEED